MPEGIVKCAMGTVSKTKNLPNAGIHRDPVTREICADHATSSFITSILDSKNLHTEDENCEDPFNADKANKK